MHVVVRYTHISIHRPNTHKDRINKSKGKTGKVRWRAMDEHP